MKPEMRRTRPAGVITIFAAALYGVLVTTGALTLVFVIAAAIGGTSVIDLYAETFPRLRGGAPGTRIPVLGYAVFVLYIVVASGIAVISRWRFAQKWSRRID